MIIFPNYEISFSNRIFNDVDDICNLSRSKTMNNADQQDVYCSYVVNLVPYISLSIFVANLFVIDK